ncbi:MAG: translation initiation factor eIF-2B [Candidatus Hodarchaeales archaeon]|jgi:ribose 1,5-bisphosphate isomerase
MSADQTLASAYQKLKIILDDIKSLKIQGASNVAIEGVNAFAQYAADVAPLFPDQEDFLTHLQERSAEVRYIRVTEPALGNGLRYVIEQILERDIESVLNAGQEFQQMILNAKQRVGEIGAEKIFDDSTIMTHCHSSFVDEVFWKAKESGKNFRVVNTETRPVFQGRKTVRKLRKKEIEVIHVVDSAMWWAMKEFDVDMIIIGADAVTVEGVALNKIGSRLLALSARELHVPLYVCSSLLKYNPETILGHHSEIEMRETQEIWPDHPPGVEVFNPAFETIASQYIAAFITEFGLIPPPMVSYTFETKYLGDLFHTRKKK